jgi:predicted dehydrogenase
MLMARPRKPSSIKVGVVGYGGAFNMGSHHLAEMKAAGMTPTAVAEIDADRLAAAHDDYPGIETYRSVTSMLKSSDVQLVTIITPHNTHAKLALQCLRAGRHVVTEKPFAITTGECDRMIAEAKKRRLMISAYHNRHWDGGILHAVKLIKQQRRIGEVLHIDAHITQYRNPGDWWRGSKSISGGVLFDWGVHMLEYALQLIDAPIVEVMGTARTGHWAKHTRWKSDTIEDEAFALVRFKTGQWLTLLISNIDKDPDPNWLKVTGTKGVYSFNYETWQLTGGGGRGKRGGDNPASRWPMYYKNIAGHLTRKQPLVITPQWARRPIHIIDLANQSAKRGKAIRAKYA